MRFVEELTNIICPLLLFCYSRGGSLLFLVKKKKITRESSPGHKAAYLGDYSFHFVILLQKSYQWAVCTTLALQAICALHLHYRKYVLMDETGTQEV